MAAQQHLQELSLSAAKAPELSTVSRTQWALEVKQMEHVVLRNRIALQIAHQAGPGDNLRVSFDFAYHPCFAVAVVKKSWNVSWAMENICPFNGSRALYPRV